MSASMSATASAPATATAATGKDHIAIGALDLAALLCSRVCHDLISPVGAIINGLEVMEEDKDEETKAFALDLIKRSAGQASAKLQFCRLAFGAAGSAGAQIELGDARACAEKPGEASPQHAVDRRRSYSTRRKAGCGGSQWRLPGDRLRPKCPLGAGRC
jgi:hypothetical protein